MQKIGTFRGDCKISVWLCQIAKNLWKDDLKKNKKLESLENEEFSVIPSKENLEENVIANQNKIDLYKKLQKLDEQTREVVYLRITGELTFKEIGDILNKTENWARVTFYRGKRKLKGGEGDERRERM